eukprot:IDg13073t1
MIRTGENASQSSSRTHDGSTSSLLAALQFAVVAYLLYLTQVYVGATLSGTRAPRNPMPVTPPPETYTGVRGAEPWSSCAGQLANTLRDAGEAGALWHRTAYVGTPGADDDSGTARANSPYACRCQVPA